MANDAYVLMGGNGGHYVNAGESAVTGSFNRILTIESTVLAGITNALIANAADLVGVTIPAGVDIGGLTTSIEVTSGSVIAYKA